MTTMETSQEEDNEGGEQEWEKWGQSGVASTGIIWKLGKAGFAAVHQDDAQLWG